MLRSSSPSRSPPFHLSLVQPKGLGAPNVRVYKLRPSRHLRRFGLEGKCGEVSRELLRKLPSLPERGSNYSKADGLRGAGLYVVEEHRYLPWLRLSQQSPILINANEDCHLLAIMSNHNRSDPLVNPLCTQTCIPSQVGVHYLRDQISYSITLVQQRMVLRCTPTNGFPPPMRPRAQRSPMRHSTS